MNNFDPSKLNLNIDEEVSENTPPIWNRNVSPVHEDRQKTSEKEKIKEEIMPQENTSTIDPLSAETHTHTPQDTGEKEQKTPEKIPASKIIDINIQSLEDVVTLLHEKEYDYIIVEPEENEVKITCKQDNIDREIRYIKYPNYTNILFKLKQLTGLILENTDVEQEGKGKVSVSSKNFHIHSKTAPWQNGERLWIRVKEDLSVQAKKQKAKTPLSAIFWFLWAILFVWLILWGAFIAFIVLNAKTVEDVKFFASLWINLNDINSFISQIVSLIFSILLFICTIALSYALLTFILTKKVLRKKRINFAILSATLLLFTFMTGSAWMYIDQQIKNLPNWQEQAYGDLKIFDNDLLISSQFRDTQALLSSSENLIGPVTLRFDLNNFQDSQAKKGFQVKKYIWSFGDITEESFTPEIIKTFSDIWNYEISVRAQGTDIEGNPLTQEIVNVPAVTISHTINMRETKTKSWGKKVSFDAQNLKNLWEVVWYFLEPKTADNPNPRYPEWTEIYTWYEFFPSDIFFYDIYVGVSLQSWNTTDPQIDKVLKLWNDGQSEIVWDIQALASLEDELSYSFQVIDAATAFGNGFIESYQWRIEDKTYSVWPKSSGSNSSEVIQHTFSRFGDQEIEVVLTDTTGAQKLLTQIITLQKQLKLRSSLIIENQQWEDLENIRYEENAHEYFIDEQGVPSTLSFIARYVRPENILYVLSDVTWDIWNDGDIDGNGERFDMEIPTAGNHTLRVNYTFEHRRNKDDIINLSEFVYIEGLKKDAVLSLDMQYEDNYVPVSVRFDASKSFIKNDDIVKFTYDYGDGIIEERDAINPWHTYKKAGDYTVRLTVTGKSGKKYSLEKSLVLLPPAQDVSIKTSLKRAPIWQGIDFSSADSQGQIMEYFWDFGDGNISTEANPTHSYSKTGSYTVTLKVAFSNNNSMSDSVNIQVYKK